MTDSATTIKALKDGIDPDQYLADFNSYHFFKKTGGHLITGPTQTNVMDLMIAVIE
jgi:hydroxypyruvate reductase